MIIRECQVARGHRTRPVVHLDDVEDFAESLSELSDPDEFYCVGQFTFYPKPFALVSFSENMFILQVTIF